MESYDVIVIGAGPGLQRCHSRRPARPEGGLRGGSRNPRRDLPERRLHAVQGPAARLGAIRRGERWRVRPARHPGQPGTGPGADDEAEGRERRRPDPWRRIPFPQAQGAVDQGLGALARRGPGRRGPCRRRPRATGGARHRHRHRFGTGAAARRAGGQPAHPRLHRRPGVGRSASPPGGDRRRRDRPGAWFGLAPAGRTGHGAGVPRADLPGAGWGNRKDPPARPDPPGHAVSPRHPRGRRAQWRAGRRTRPATGRRRRYGIAAGGLRAGGHRPAPLYRRTGAGDGRPGQRSSWHAGEPGTAQCGAGRLGDRRRDLGTDAGAQGRGRGDRLHRADRRACGGDERRGDSVGHLHPAGSGQRRPRRGAVAGGEARVQGRTLPVQRQQPGEDQPRERRLHQDPPMPAATRCSACT